MSPSTPKTHVVVVGGGAAGMACAATLAQHPEKFKVTLLEAQDVVGGQATSIPVDAARFGADWLNNGVQGGSGIFKHTFNFMRSFGAEPRQVQLQVSFGKGVDGFWTNCFPSQMAAQFAGDIRKFGFLLQLVRWTLPVLGLVPISILLRLLLFNKDFGDKMVYPLIALFLGTGNQTAHVPSGIVERLFNDPNMKLWDYDADSLLPNLPTMYTFDELHGFYAAWARSLMDKGVDIRLSTTVSRVVRRSNDRVVLQVTGRNGAEYTRTETYDHMVLCVLADEAKRILGATASRRERFVLGGAAFYDDITVTHADKAYFESQYETLFDPSLCAEPKSQTQEDQIEAISRGRPSFRPMYYTKSYRDAPSLIEMSFDCSNYQHQLLDATSGPEGQKLEHVYQTIFLDQSRSHLWTINQIDESKIIEKKWWHQLGHRWQHYLRVVPMMMFLNGRNRTWFAGSWTLVNMHEVACVSGIAAAYRLGADYIKFDDFAEDFFAKYLLLSHGVRYHKEQRRRAKR